MNGIVTKWSDKVVVRNRLLLQVVNMLSTMIKDVIFAMFFQYLHKSFGYLDARTFFQLYGFTNGIILTLISGHGNESCLHNLSLDVHACCSFANVACSLRKVSEVLIYNSCHIRQSTQNYWEGVVQSSSSVLITPWTNSLSVHLLLQVINVCWRFL